MSGFTSEFDQIKTSGMYKTLDGESVRSPKELSDRLGKQAMKDDKQIQPVSKLHNKLSLVTKSQSQEKLHHVKTGSTPNNYSSSFGKSLKVPQGITDLPSNSRRSSQNQQQSNNI